MLKIEFNAENLYDVTKNLTIFFACFATHIITQILLKRVGNINEIYLLRRKISNQHIWDDIYFLLSPFKTICTCPTTNLFV
jgi:hypothetical protein